MEHNAKVISKIEIEAWAEAPEGVSVDQLITDVEKAGNPILEVDRENRRVKIAYVVQEAQEA